VPGDDVVVVDRSAGKTQIEVEQRWRVLLEPRREGLFEPDTEAVGHRVAQIDDAALRVPVASRPLLDVSGIAFRIEHRTPIDGLAMELGEIAVCGLGIFQVYPRQEHPCALDGGEAGRMGQDRSYQPLGGR
jgi:hypothetical protein